MVTRLSLSLNLQLVLVTKQLCGVRGTAATDFSLSLARFLQQISSILRLVGLVRETLHATVTTAHLMEATAPGNFLHSPLQVCVCVFGVCERVCKCLCVCVAW